MDKIKIGIVNYLNTRPLIYGLERSPIQDQIELIGNYPSNIAKALLQGDIDAGLVPVAIIPELPTNYIISDYCIGCNGAVASVGIFSDVPIEEVEEVYLDYQSRTSVELARILLREYWKVEPKIMRAKTDFISNIQGRKAAVVIGDRALKQHQHSRYCYDLGEAWKLHTGLPFAFAVWVSIKELDPRFVSAFNMANGMGFDHLKEIIQAEQFTAYPLEKYYTENVQYKLSADKLEAMELFWMKMKLKEEVLE